MYQLRISALSFTGGSISASLNIYKWQGQNLFSYLRFNTKWNPLFNHLLDSTNTIILPSPFKLISNNFNPLLYTCTFFHIFPPDFVCLTDCVFIFAYVFRSNLQIITVKLIRSSFLCVISGSIIVNTLYRSETGEVAFNNGYIKVSSSE